VTASALTAAPAWAHAELTSIAPDDGAILDAPPRRIELTFSEPLITAAATVVVTDDQDVVVTRDRSRVDGTSVSVPWPPELPPGDYTIAFRVVSGDGHPIKGTSRFTLRPSGPTSPEDASPPAQPEPPDDQQSSRLVLGLLTGVIAAIGVGSVVVVRRRRAA
jgi:copper resistance protein C